MKIKRKLSPAIKADPPQSEINEIIDLIQKNNLNLAKNKSTRITKKYPQYGNGYLLLATALKGLRLFDEALKAISIAADCMPYEAIVYFNKGNIYSQMSCDDLAIKSYLDALKLNDRFIEAYINVSNIYLKHKNYDEAIKYLKDATMTDEMSFISYFNLGNAYKESGQLNKAICCYQTAIKLNITSTESHNNLGNVYMASRKYFLAKKQFQKALKIDPQNCRALFNYALLLFHIGDFNHSLDTFEQVIVLDGENLELLMSYSRVLEQLGLLDKSQKISNKISGIFDKQESFREINREIYIENISRELILCHLLSEGHRSYKELDTINGIERLIDFIQVDQSSKSSMAYINYMRLLLDVYKFNSNDFIFDKIYIIGDSHSLSPHNSMVNILGKYFLGESIFISGIKMWHLDPLSNNHRRKVLERRLNAIPRESYLLFTIGEIDFRPDEGVWKAQHKYGDLNELMKNTINGYIENLKLLTRGRDSLKIIIQGIPAPRYNLSSILDLENEKSDFIKLIYHANSYLKQRVLAAKYMFMDVYRATANHYGLSNSKWHLDYNHLHPDFYRLCGSYLWNGLNLSYNPDDSVSTPSSTILLKRDSKMTKITIDEKEYEIDNLSPEAKSQLESMLAADTKIAELQRDLAIAQTARNAYAIALKELLPKK